MALHGSSDSGIILIRNNFASIIGLLVSKSTKSEWLIHTVLKQEFFSHPRFNCVSAGAPHMAEIPYVWGYGKLLNNQAVRDDSGIHYDVVGWTPEDATYADYQITLWTNFAKYGLV